ncbi:MAG: haloalkane dehalogenase [Syntrophales bacterium]|jgi:haloalkane dehalogenase|nr:haloalkane dehalogenase [Syntrophales bacterium]MDY0044298.1 haloalkane dehalogenase [Syntrophales bacterium]
MKFINPAAEELAVLRDDPLLSEQEFDDMPEVAAAVEKAAGMRAGRVYWRSDHDYLYGLELADLGKGRPSMATVYGFRDRYEPRPPEHEIEADLIDFLLWLAEIAEGIEGENIKKLIGLAKKYGRCNTGWPEGSVLRTPEDRFLNLPGFDYEPHYMEIEGLRMAYVEKGAGDPILMLHGEPTWGYLYRKMIPPLAEIGRVIVPDQIGFGRSDKPVEINAYSYKSFARWMRKFILALDLSRITLVCQDWGGLIGLRVLSQIPERFGRLVAMSTGIPYGKGAGSNEGFLRWRHYAQRQNYMDVPEVMQSYSDRCALSEGEQAAYRAPFPSAEYQAGAFTWPRLVPIRINHPGNYDNYAAVKVLKTLDIPVFLPWGDRDPLKEGEGALRNIFKHCAPPQPIADTGHYIQESSGEEVADHIRKWIMKTPLAKR